MNATVERFLQYLRLERNLSWRTVDLYRRDLEQWDAFVTGGNGNLDLASVTASDIRAWNATAVTCSSGVPLRLGTVNWTCRRLPLATFGHGS